MVSRGVIAAFLLTACLALAACGGGDGDSSSADKGSTSGDDGSTVATATGPTLKKAAYVKKGDAICQKIPKNFQPLYEDLLSELKKKKKKLSKKAETEEINLKAAVPPIRNAAKEFQTMGVPKGEEELATEIVEALEAAGDGVEKDPNKPLTGPESSFVEFSKLTKKHGFTFCPQL